MTNVSNPFLFYLLISPPIPFLYYSNLWNVAGDVLRGLFKLHDYGDLILPFVILRRLDYVLESKKNQVFELYESLKNKLN